MRPCEAEQVLKELLGDKQLAWVEQLLERLQVLVDALPLTSMRARRDRSRSVLPRPSLPALSCSQKPCPSQHPAPTQASGHTRRPLAPCSDRDALLAGAWAAWTPTASCAGRHPTGAAGPPLRASTSQATPSRPNAGAVIRMEVVDKRTGDPIPGHLVRDMRIEVWHPRHCQSARATFPCARNGAGTACAQHTCQGTPHPAPHGSSTHMAACRPAYS